MRILNRVGELVGDTGYALRVLRKRPGFTAIAILSLAIGIGVNTALFSVVDAVVLHPVPLPDAGRVVVVDEYKDGKRSNGNPPRTYDWGAFTPAFQSVTGYYGEDLVLTGHGDATKLSALRTCGDPLGTLNVRLTLGRGFSAIEQKGQGELVAILSHDAWQRRFEGDPRILGRALALSGKAYTVIGVLPAGLNYPAGSDVWLPIPHAAQEQTGRGAGFLSTVALLRSGAALEDVQPQLQVVAARLETMYPATDKGLSARAVSLNEFETRESREPILILWGTAAVVLLLACLNFACLLLSRGLARRRESAIRVALGAGRIRLMRLYLSESVLIALLGGLVGLAAASLTLNLLVSLLPATLPNLSAVALNPRAIWGTVGLSVLCGLLAGWVPAWRISTTASQEGLRDREAFSTRQSQWLQKALLACQVALSVILLTGAILLTRSLMKITSEPLGFRPENVLTVSIDMPWDTPPQKLTTFSEQVIQSFAGIPGVRAVGMVDRLPLKGGTQGRSFNIRNRPLPEGRPNAEVSLRAIAGSYFMAVGTPLVAGRSLNDHPPAAGHEVVVNQAFIAQYFPGENALDQAIRIDDASDKSGAAVWWEIVGVVGNVRQEAPKETPPELYVAASDTYWPMQVYLLRATGDPHRLIPGVRQAVRQIDPAQFIDHIETMEDTVSGAHAQPRMRAQVLGIFALVALLLTALGIYGLQAQAVALRTKEIGVRMALGAKPAEASATILRQNLAVVGVGLMMGILGGALITGLLKTLLYGVSALDPLAFAAGAAGLLLTAAFACYLPARRAAAVDPMIALRHD